MIKGKPGGSYAATVAAAKTAVDPAEIGAAVKCFRRSMEGHTIIEFDRAATAHEAAGKLVATLAQKTSDTVGAILLLGSVVKAKVMGVDRSVSKEEVLEVIRAAASQCTPTSELAPTAVTGLWPSRRAPKWFP